MSHAIFHLSLPTRDLRATEQFYCDVLAATLGRVTTEWIDVILFGHQITFHQRPDEMIPEAKHGVQHFGAILGWEAWQALCARLQSASWPLVAPPVVFGRGTRGEHAKVLLRDPSGHLMEFKAYRDLSTVIPNDGSPD